MSKQSSRNEVTPPDVNTWSHLGYLGGGACRSGSENGLSLNLLWSSILAAIEVWLKFDRVSGPLYLIHEINRVQKLKCCLSWIPLFDAYLRYKVLSEISK